MRKKVRTASLKSLKNKCWQVVRKRVLERDGYRCTLCGSRKNLQVDHFLSRRHMGTFFLVENLSTLCGRCHTNKSFNYGSTCIDLLKAVENREGLEMIQTLIRKTNGVFKITAEYLEEIINRYKTIDIRQEETEASQA